MGQSLDRYRRKRDFRRTPEPKGGRRRSTQNPRFVIHEHDATSHHFDLRLEAEGVLKSWAVPKGPSTDPRDKRLALPTEDHPLEYRDFEGVIPEGEYGAGPVIVWDAGTYDNLTEDDAGDPLPLARGLERGHVVVCLHGEKISGGYALTRLGRSGRWLLVKTDDADADRRRKPAKTQPASVKTGRTLDDVREADANR